MPQYELMYIVASTVSDDQIPSVTEGVLNYISTFGGKVLKEELMGKKKLAYPIAKTRNGFYAGVTFEMPSEKVNELDTKIRTTEGIIRHLIVNMEEANRRMAKDAVIQEKMNQLRAANPRPEVTETKGEVPVPENLDEKIEEALSEDLAKV